MVIDFLAQINEIDIVLASGSPRRKKLLEKIGIKFRVVSSTFEENLSKNTTVQDYVKSTAQGKAEEVWNRSQDRPGLLISADTVISFNGQILEKPKDKADAKRILGMLSGKNHEVLTGVTLMRENSMKSFVVCTKVQFSDLSESAIEAYVESEEPMDKAGGYGIQGKGSQFVSELHGCYYNVMGFPLNRFCRELTDFLELSHERPAKRRKLNSKSGPSEQ